MGLMRFSTFEFKKILTNAFLPEIKSASLIYHYTSGDALIHIMQENELKFWASRVDCLNDMEEEHDALRIFGDVCEELRKKEMISNDFYELISQANITHRDQIMYLSDNTLKNKTTTVESCICTRYIICFSMDQDSLPMWNYYSNGSSYEGVNIGISLAALKEYIDSSKDRGYGIKLVSVLYDDNKKRDLVESLIKNVYKYYGKAKNTDILNFIDSYINYWSLCFKNESFKHENEYRLIYSIPDEIKGNSIEIEKFPICHRYKRGIFIPYINVKIDKNVVVSVTLGPLMGDSTKNRQVEIMKGFLNDLEYYCAENVKVSKIPIRY